MTYPISNIDGLPSFAASKLKSLGIRTTDGLLEAARTVKGRKALDTARRGDADLLLVHDPEAERQFMDEGHGSTRRQIAWNDFIIVGPSADPAHVKGGHDSVAALKAIDAAPVSYTHLAGRAREPW